MDKSLNGKDIAEHIRKTRLVPPHEIIDEYLMRGGKLESCKICYCKGIKAKKWLDEDEKNENYFCDCKAGQVLKEANVCLICLNTGWMMDDETEYLNSSCGTIQSQVYKRKRCGCGRGEKG